MWPKSQIKGLMIESCCVTRSSSATVPNKTRVRSLASFSFSATTPLFVPRSVSMRYMVYVASSTSRSRRARRGVGVRGPPCVVNSGIVRDGFRLKLGIIADAHLRPVGTSFPPVLGFPSVPYEYEKSDDITRYRRALKRCVEEGVDGVALLGDLSRVGDAISLETGLKLAARTGRTVWAVMGNHECYERVDSLARAVRWVGADN